MVPVSYDRMILILPTRRKIYITSGQLILSSVLSETRQNGSILCDTLQDDDEKFIYKSSCLSCCKTRQAQAGARNTQKNDGLHTFTQAMGVKKIYMSPWRLNIGKQFAIFGTKQRHAHFAVGKQAVPSSCQCRYNERFPAPGQSSEPISSPALLQTAQVFFALGCFPLPVAATTVWWTAKRQTTEGVVVNKSGVENVPRVLGKVG
ncbi:hypothetical protein B0H13DRAFT_1907550 [Mycena leptocephala]|nr:hypothetical protein B0H13DRAFT_1907550 [Mycena leptocephala]